jgi:cytidylate kinase
MYRALAWFCLQKGTDLNNSDEVVSLLKKTEIDILHSSEGKYSFKILVDGQDVTDNIFKQKVAMATAKVSMLPEVRKEMVKRQQELARDNPVVMEGRDIGLRVLPGAGLKIYLTASIEARAKRRYLQFVKKGSNKTLDEVINETKSRDTMDSTRETDPLQKLPDAWELDTTDLTQEAVVDKIIAELKRRNLV